MAQASAGLHESSDALRPETVDRHRAIVSIMEELEAVDWYDQRQEAAQDAELRAILAHNRDEEKEHAVMVLEWLRRRDAQLDAQLRTYLFSDKPILAIERTAESGGGDAAEASADPSGADGSLGIGSLRRAVRS
jgi:ferritin-like protein